MSVDLEIVRQLVQLEPYELLAGIAVDDLPGDWRCVFEERAAMREFHGEQLPRELAEAEALAETVRMMEAEKNEKILR